MALDGSQFKGTNSSFSLVWHRRNQLLAGYRPVGFKTKLNFSFDLHIFNLKHSNLFLHALIRIKSTYISTKYFIKQLLCSIIHVDTKLCETVNYIVPSLCYRIRFNWVEFNCFVFTLQMNFHMMK